MTNEENEYRVTADATLASTWIDDDSGVRQATKYQPSIRIRDGIHTGDKYLTLEMYDPDDDCSVLNLWKFEDIDEFEALAELMLDRVEEVRKDVEMGLVE